MCGRVGLNGNLENGRKDVAQTAYFIKEKLLVSSFENGQLGSWLFIRK